MWSGTILRYLSILCLAVLLAACGGGGGSSDTSGVTDTGSAVASNEPTPETDVSDSNDEPEVEDPVDTTETAETESGAGATLEPWLINTTEQSDQIFESATTSQGVLYDVQLAEAVVVNSANYVYVETTGIPRYDILMTEELVQSLNNRPRAATDFTGGVTSATVGQTVVFGEDIGYNSSNQNCNDTGGAGYWPPGPVCPTSMNRTEYFAMEPNPGGDTCESGLGTIGLMVNGSAVFNWGDGQSEGSGIWYTLAPVAEQYDVDICGGHAANGEYHHHFYTSCLAELVGDDGSEHSPIYGFAGDGYALYGPYEADGVLAVSGWDVRDYGAPSDQGGCNTPGERSCVLVDEYDLNQGVDTAVTAGPAVGATVTTLSGNSLIADQGYYYEDYYFGGREATGSQLDQHNGHDNNDGRGYHYHITLTEDDQGKLQPAFPYTIGPRFYGELPDNSLASCGGATGGPAGGPGGSPPGG